MIAQEGYELIVATGTLRASVIALLEVNDLPVIDLDSEKTLFGLMHNEKLVGTGGLEHFNDCCLLRSISVSESHRRRGLGRLIVQKLEQSSRELGCRALYLLTTSAKHFFEREGYKEVDRANIPLSLRESSEFASVCPSSAIVMQKMLR